MERAHCRCALTKASLSTKRGGGTSTAPNIAGASGLDERRAYPLMAQVIAEHEERLRREIAGTAGGLFDEAAETWLAHLRTERRAKPSTLRNYRNLLARPSSSRRQRCARILRSFGGRPLFGIATKDVRQFLSRLDHEDLSPRTVNIHRQVLHAIFEYARREETFGLPENPVARTTKRPEDETAPIETFEPGEIRAVAAVAREVDIDTGPATGTRSTRSRRSASGSGSATRTPRSSSSPRRPGWGSSAPCATSSAERITSSVVPTVARSTARRSAAASSGPRRQRVCA
jgi:hypothetical protein